MAVPPRFRALVAVLAALCASWMSSPGVADAGIGTMRFGRPVVVGTGFLEDVAVNARGEALALWRRDRAVGVTGRSVAGRWGRPVTLGRFRCTRGPRVAMNARGDAAAVWTRGCDEHRLQPLVVSTRVAQHRWSAPRAIGRARGWPELGVTRRGMAVIAWGGRAGLWVTSGRGGRWSTAERLPGAWGTFALDVAASGRAAVVGYDPSGLIALSRRSPSGAWTRRRAVPGLSVEQAPEFRVAIADDGRLVVAQGTYDFNGPNAVEVAEYGPSEGWSPPRTLATVPNQPYALSLDLNDRGEAVVGWSQYRPAPRTRSRYGGYADGHSEVFVASRSAAHAWSTPQRLSTARIDTGAVMGHVAITARGELFATWEVSANPRGWSVGIEAATGSISGGWRRRVTIDGPDRRRMGNGPRLAAAGGPHAIIGWTDPPGAQISALR